MARQLARMGVALLSPAQGLGMLWEVLGAIAGPPLVLATTMRWAAAMAAVGDADRAFYRAVVASEMCDEGSTEPDASSEGPSGSEIVSDNRAPTDVAASTTHPDQAPQRQRIWTQEAVEALVLALVGEAVGSSVEATAPFMAAGLDSLASADFLASLAKDLGLEVPVTVLYDHPTARQLAAALFRELSSKSMVGEGQASAVPMAGVPSTAAPAAEPAAPTRGQTAASKSTATAPPPNPEAPTLSAPGYFCIPPPQALARLSSAQLAALPRFVLGHRDHGEFQFLQPVDLRGARLDAMLRMDRGRARFVPLLPDGAPAPRGAALNRPCLLMLKGIGSASWEGADLAALRKKLAAASAAMGGTFIDYFPDSGQWLTKLDGFEKGKGGKE